MLPNESGKDAAPVGRHPASTPAARRAPGYRATSSWFRVPSAWLQVEGRLGVQWWFSDSFDNIRQLQSAIKPGQGKISKPWA
jgi:hypothetical protein